MRGAQSAFRTFTDGYVRKTGKRPSLLKPQMNWRKLPDGQDHAAPASQNTLCRSLRPLMRIALCPGGAYENSPAGTTENSPAIHCRDGGSLNCQVLQGRLKIARQFIAGAGSLSHRNNSGNSLPGRYRVLFDHADAVRIIEIQEVKKRDERTY